MAIKDAFKLKLLKTTRKRPPLHAHLAHMHTEEDPLAFVMLLPHFSDVCSVFLAIMVECIMEVYMDNITVYGGSFEECLINLETVLHRCIEKNLVLN